MTLTATVNYEGALRTTCTHVKSGDSFQTDAPTDNQGKGEAFSPTDLLATSLPSCMLTTMGIRAAKENIPFPNAFAEMTKVMASDPRRVVQIIVTINMPEEDYNSAQKSILETTALNCPVAKSLHPDIDQVVTFEYPMKG